MLAWTIHIAGNENTGHNRLAPAAPQRADNPHLIHVLSIEIRG